MPLARSLLQTEPMQSEVLHQPTSMGDSALPGAPARGEQQHRHGLRRRRFWIDRTSQLPITLLAVGACLFFVILFNATMLETTTARRQQIADSPQLEQRMLEEDQALQRYLFVLSGVFLVCMVAGIVVLTQRSAGPVHRIRAHLDRLADGELDHSVSLRQRDHFQGLALSFNALAAALRQRTATEAEELESFAATAESCSTPAEVLALAANLRQRAQDKRRALGSGPTS